MLVWLGPVVSCIFCQAAVAHHSFAMFDQSKSVTLQGSVREVRWTNPHVFIQLLTTSEHGDQEEWSIEMTSPEHLARVGWRPRTLKAGDKVTIVIHPTRDGAKGGQFLSGIGPQGPLAGGSAARQSAQE
jgi:hypothetical protein